MGQPRLQVVNKLGINNFWESSWDNNVKYKNNLYEQFFIKSFFKSILITKMDKTSFFKKKSFYEDFFNKDIIKGSKKIYTYNRYILYLKKRTITYCGKVWFIKYQNWTLVSTYVYSPINRNKNTSLKRFSVNSTRIIKEAIINRNVF